MKTYTPEVRAENAVAAKYKSYALAFFRKVSAQRQQNNLPLLQKYTAAAEGVLVCVHCSEHSNWVYLWGGEVPISGLVWRDDLDGIFSTDGTKIKRVKIPAPDFYYGCRHWANVDGSLRLSWNSFVAYSPWGEAGNFRRDTPGTDAGPIDATQPGIYLGGYLIAGTDAMECIGAAVLAVGTTPETHELRVVSRTAVKFYEFDLARKLVGAQLYSTGLPSNDVLEYSVANFNSTGSEFLVQCAYQQAFPLTSAIKAVHGSVVDDAVVFVDLNAFESEYDEFDEPIASHSRWFAFAVDVVTEVYDFYGHGLVSETIATYPIPDIFPPITGGADITKVYSYISRTLTFRRRNTLTINGAVVATNDVTTTHYAAMQYTWNGSAWTVPGPSESRTYIDPSTEISFTTFNLIYNEPGMVVTQLSGVNQTVIGGFSPPIGAYFFPPADPTVGQMLSILETHSVLVNGNPIIVDTLSAELIGVQYSQPFPTGFPLSQTAAYAPFDIRQLVLPTGTATALRFPLNFYGYDWSEIADDVHWQERLDDWAALGSPMIMLVNGVDILTERPPQPAVLSYIKAYMRANDLTGEVAEDIILEALKGMKFGYLGVV